MGESNDANAVYWTCKLFPTCIWKGTVTDGSFTLLVFMDLARAGFLVGWHCLGGEVVDSFFHQMA